MAKLTDQQLLVIALGAVLLLIVLVFGGTMSADEAGVMVMCVWLGMGLEKWLQSKHPKAKR